MVIIFFNNAKELYLNRGYYMMIIISEKGLACLQHCSSTPILNSVEVNSNSQMPPCGHFPGIKRKSGNLRE